MQTQLHDSTSASMSPLGFLRLKQVLRLVPIGRSTLYRNMKLGTFPQAIKLGRRITVWRTEDIHRYMQNPR